MVYDKFIFKNNIYIILYMVDVKNKKNRPVGLKYKVKNKNNTKNFKTDNKSLGIKFTYGAYVITF